MFFLPLCPFVGRFDRSACLSRSRSVPPVCLCCLVCRSVCLSARPPCCLPCLCYSISKYGVGCASNPDTVVSGVAYIPVSASRPIPSPSRKKKNRCPTASSCAPSAQPTRLRTPRSRLSRPALTERGAPLQGGNRPGGGFRPVRRMGRWLLLESSAARGAAWRREGGGSTRGTRGGPPRLVSALRGSACSRRMDRRWT